MTAACVPSTIGTTRGSRVAWAVWVVGVLAYVVTVMQRTSLGVAGLEASTRLAVSPAMLSAFVFIQVAVYIVAQIPAGLLVDRYGTRAMLVISGLLLVAGQLVLASAGSLGPAVLARVLVGAADAIVFVGVLALVPRWFPARRVPLLIQITMILGQLGQILSAVPFLTLLQVAGWSTAFGVAAATSALVAVLVLAVVQDGPAGGPAPAPAVPAREQLGQVAAVWRRPGTRVGFFGHMGTQFSMMVFALLWGVPFLVSGQGLTAGEAGRLVALFVVCAIVIGPLMGLLTVRYPMRRSWLLLAVIAADVAVWTAILAQPGPAPRWLLVVLALVLALGGPGSVVGLDIGRTSNPGANLGVAQSMVNLGGFSASLLVLALMGAVLTAMGGYGPDSFRVAWMVQYPVWAFAVAGLLFAGRRARRVRSATG